MLVMSCVQCHALPAEGKGKLPEREAHPRQGILEKGPLRGMLLTDKSVLPPKHGPGRPPDGVHSSLCLTANRMSQYGRRRRFQCLSQGGS
ncbi:hypothetical protein V8C34DRAFT_279486 [Trichoderma compactum]